MLAKSVNYFLAQMKDAGTVVLGFLAAGMIYRQLRDKEAEQNLLHIQSGKIMMIASGFCIIVLIRAVGVVCQSY